MPSKQLEVTTNSSGDSLQIVSVRIGDKVVTPLSQNERTDADSNRIFLIQTDNGQYTLMLDRNNNWNIL